MSHVIADYFHSDIGGKQGCKLALHHQMLSC